MLTRGSGGPGTGWADWCGLRLRGQFGVAQVPFAAAQLCATAVHATKWHRRVSAFGVGTFKFDGLGTPLHAGFTRLGNWTVYSMAAIWWRWYLVALNAGGVSDGTDDEDARE